MVVSLVVYNCRDLCSGIERYSAWERREKFVKWIFFVFWMMFSFWMQICQDSIQRPTLVHFQQTMNLEHIWPVAHGTQFMVSFDGSTVNCFVYCFIWRDFRQGFQRVSFCITSRLERLKCHLSRALSDLSSRD